jgi:hypothetical protein
MQKKKPIPTVLRPQKGSLPPSVFQKKIRNITNPEELMRLASEIARVRGMHSRPVEEDEEYEDEEEAFEEEEIVPEKPVRRAVSTALVPRVTEPVEPKKKAPAYTRMPWYVYGMSETEAMVIDLYAKGFNQSDINEHLGVFHNTKMDGATINAITDKVHPLIKEWQSRPLSSQYMVGNLPLNPNTL